MEASWQGDRRTQLRPDRRNGARGGARVCRLALLLAAGPLGSCQDDPPGVHIDVEVEDEAFRPQFVKFHWLRPGRKPFEERLPESGDFAATGGNPLGSLFVQTVGPLQQPRGIALRGFRDGKEISGVVVGIKASESSQRRFRATLGPILRDSDENGVPDIVDDNCFDDSGPATCQNQPIDGQRDAGTPPPSDAGTPAEVAPPPPDAATDASTVSEGLVAFWRFDDGSGTTAVDSSGNKHTGQLRGADLAWTEGRAGGGALDIPNMPNHGVTVPPAPDIDAIRRFTISAWLYRTDERSGLANILSRRSSGSAEHYALAISADGFARVYLNSHASPSGLPLSSPTEIPLDSWTHLAATYDGANVRLYVNGTEVATTPATSTIDGKGSSLCIGCGQNSDTMLTEPATGRLDDLRLYSRALDAAEIAAVAR